MKKNLKKLAIPVALMVFLSTPAFARSEQGYDDYTGGILSKQSDDSHYISFVGVIDEINKDNDIFYITVREDDKTKIFRIHENTLLLDNENKTVLEAEKLEEGQNVNVFFRSGIAMDLPERFSVQAESLTNDSNETEISPEVVIIESNEHTSVRLDVFDNDLLNTDGDLQLNVSDETKIVDWEGNPVYKDEIQNKTLIVFYSVTTRSNPAQTSPEKIIVLDNNIAINDYQDKQQKDYKEDYEREYEEEYKKDYDRDQTNSLYEDNFPKIKDNIYTKNDVTYMGLSAIAKEVGYNVSWDEELRQVTLTNGHRFFEFTIGVREFKYNGEEHILNNAPIIINDRTFIEQSFLDKLL